MVVVTRDPQPEDTTLTSNGKTSLPDPKQPGKWIVLDPAQTRAKLLTDRDYIVQDAGPFLLATPRNLLGVQKARKEMALLREVARRATDGTRVLAVKDLPKEEGETLRGFLSGSPWPEVARVASAPYLRFGIATMGTFDIQAGRLQKPLQLPPGTGLGPDELRASWKSVMRPDAEDAAAGIPPPDSKVPAKAKPAAPEPQGRLTFIVPNGLPGDQGLEWMGKAQAILLKDAHEARVEWTEARDALLAALKKESDAPFAHPLAPGRIPTFADLTPEAQNKAANYFQSCYRSELGGAQAQDLLLGASVLGFRSEPVLTVCVADGGPGWYTNTFHLQCPVGP